jgi:hypothetical protein
MLQKHIIIRLCKTPLQYVLNSNTGQTSDQLIIITEFKQNKGCGLAIYIKKCFKAKEELWKLKYFTIKKYNLQKIF